MTVFKINNNNEFLFNILSLKSLLSLNTPLKKLTFTLRFNPASQGFLNEIRINQMIVVEL